jgi:hypothetical protein
MFVLSLRPFPMGNHFHLCWQHRLLLAVDRWRCSTSMLPCQEGGPLFQHSELLSPCPKRFFLGDEAVRMCCVASIQWRRSWTPLRFSG